MTSPPPREASGASSVSSAAKNYTDRLPLAWGALGCWADPAPAGQAQAIAAASSPQSPPATSAEFCMQDFSISAASVLETFQSSKVHEGQSEANLRLRLETIGACTQLTAMTPSTTTHARYQGFCKAGHSPFGVNLLREIIRGADDARMFFYRLRRPTWRGSRKVVRR